MLPSPIVSSGSILALWFTTDFAVSAQGFKAIYEGKKHCFFFIFTIQAYNDYFVLIIIAYNLFISISNFYVFYHS